MTIHSSLCALAVAVLALAGPGSLVRADDLDDIARDLEATKRDLEETRKILSEVHEILRNRFQREGLALFADQTGYVATKKAGDRKRWTYSDRPYRPGVKPTRGPVLRASWSSGRDGAPADEILVVVLRYPHGGDAVRVGEREIPAADPLALVAALSEEWAGKLVAIPMPPAPARGEARPELSAEQELEKKDARERKPPKKRSVGVAQFTAVAQGTLAESGERWRREWYGWTHEGATFVAVIRYHANVLGKRSTLSKGQKVVKAIKMF